MVHLKSRRDGSENHILVVDDESSVARYLQAKLENSGFSTTICTDSSKAWELFRQNPDRFGMIITDQTMPRLTGLQLAKKILGLNHNIPIIICTGYSDKIDEYSAKALGFYAYLNKPIDSNRLLQCISDYFMTTANRPSMPAG